MGKLGQFSQGEVCPTVKLSGRPAGCYWQCGAGAAGSHSGTPRLPPPDRLRAPPLAVRSGTQLLIRCIRGSPLTHDPAGGQEFSIDYLRASAPQFAKRRSRNSSITPPLEGESQKSSRMAKASAVGGSHKQRPMARSCAPSRVRTGQPTGEGRSGGGPTPASPNGRAEWRRLLRWGVRTRRAKGEILCAVAGSHRPTYRRRLIRRGANADAPARDARSPRASAAENS